MSTRCNVALLLREEDRNKTFGAPWDEYLTVSPDGAKYLNIYIHNDGYPEGVGRDLVEMMSESNYEDALDFILEGDRSTMRLSYHEWRDEPWQDVKPAPMYQPTLDNDYLYRLVEQPDGRMTVEVYDDTNDDWDPLY